MSKRLIGFTTFFVCLLAIAGVSNSCEKNQYEVSENMDDSGIANPLSWLKPFEDGHVKRNEIFILRETLIGSTADNPPFRLTANFWNFQKDAPLNLSKLVIGDVVLFPDTEPEREGKINQLFSNNYNSDAWEVLGSYSDQNVSVSVFDESGLVENFTINPASSLKPSVSQGADNPLVLGKLDKTQPLTFKWPIPANELSLRDEDSNQFKEVVGASLIYQPKTSLDITGNASLPQETITVNKTELFDLGSLTFTAADLELLPSNGFVTVYIGRLRYEVDEAGELVSSPAGTTTYTGGGSTGPLIRVVEP